ncbi:Alpha/beta hydrolase fold-3 domain-containing protein [[Candida] zeylanoides]
MSTLKRVPSVSTVATLLGIPLYAAYELIKFYALGSEYKRFENDLSGHLTYTIYTRVLSITRSDTHFLTSYQARSIFSYIKFKNPAIVSRLSLFGKQYEESSIWIHKVVDREKGDPIIVYLHGGAYLWNLGPSQLQAVLAVFSLVSPEKRASTSILYLDYKLASQGYAYPHQLHQLEDMYTQLTVKDGHTNIIFMGDSCGANLGLNFIQHLKHTSQGDAAIVYPSNLLLISPWVKVNPDPDQNLPGKSYYDNDKRDMIKFDTFRSGEFHKLVFGDADLNPVTISPLSTPSCKSDYKDIPTYDNNVFVLCGEHETFRDDILEWCELLYDCPLSKTNPDLYNNSNGKFKESIHSFRAATKNGSVGVQVFVEPLGVHDSSFIFEGGITKRLDSDTVTVDAINRRKYFGIVRMAEFLNGIL